MAMATDYQDFKEYEDDYLYKRGNYVKHRNNIWVSRHNLSSITPEENKFSWAKVNITDVNEWKSSQTYILGKAVKHNGKMFFSKSLWPISVDSLHSHYKWVEFSHPAIGFDLPSFDPQDPKASTIIGIDTNQNNIRDDYEIKIIMSDKPVAIKVLALKAGEKYQNLMLSSDTIGSMSAEIANNIMNGLILAEQCKRKIDRENTGIRTWKKSEFFNTFDRIKQNRLLQNKLYRIIDENNLTTSIENPCTVL